MAIAVILLTFLLSFFRFLFKELSKLNDEKKNFEGKVMYATTGRTVVRDTPLFSHSVRL